MGFFDEIIQKVFSDVLNSTVKQKRSKAIDMRYYWLNDRIEQKQYHVHWKPGSLNEGDYFTKHHSPAHHVLKRPTYLQPILKRSTYLPPTT